MISTTSLSAASPYRAGETDHGSTLNTAALPRHGFFRATNQRFITASNACSTVNMQRERHRVSLAAVGSNAVSIGAPDVAFVRALRGLRT